MTIIDRLCSQAVQVMNLHHARRLVTVHRVALRVYESRQR